MQPPIEMRKPPSKHELRPYEEIKSLALLHRRCVPRGRRQPVISLRSRSVPVRAFADDGEHWAREACGQQLWPDGVWALLHHLWHRAGESPLSLPYPTWALSVTPSTASWAVCQSLPVERPCTPRSARRCALCPAHACYGVPCIQVPRRRHLGIMQQTQSSRQAMLRRHAQPQA